MALLLNGSRDNGTVQEAANATDWDQVFTEQLPRVFNFLRYRVDHDRVAEDLTSSTFERAWRCRASYNKNLAAFNTWLFTIARNLATDYLRGRREVVLLDESIAAPGEPSVEELVERNEEFHKLHLALRELPLRERELIALKFGGGCTNREIAILMKLGESNVGTIVQRTMTKLREQMSDESNFLDKRTHVKWKSY